MITKEITHDHHVLEDGHIQVREITRIMEDGKELSKTYHRHVVAPGDDVTNEDPRCQQIACTVHTDKAIKAHIHRIEKTKNKVLGELTGIIADYDDANEVSEGETIEGEELKKVSVWNRLKNWMYS